MCVCVCVYEPDAGKRSNPSPTNQSNQIPVPFIALAVFPFELPACWSRNKFLWLNHIKLMYLEIRSHTCELQIYFNPLHDGNDDIYHSHLWGTPTWWDYSENRAFWVISSVLGDQWHSARAGDQTMSINLRDWDIKDWQQDVWGHLMLTYTRNTFRWSIFNIFWGEWLVLRWMRLFLFSCFEWVHFFTRFCSSCSLQVHLSLRRSALFYTSLLLFIINTTVTVISL